MGQEGGGGGGGAPVGPEVIDMLQKALSDQDALSVTPYVFSSVEQEGRWKNRDWAYNYQRDLVNPAMVTPTLTDNQGVGGLDVLTGQSSAPPGSAVRIPVQQAPPTTAHERKLFQLTIPGALDKQGNLVISVIWYADQLEIWGGYAGLSYVNGFLTPIGDQAGIVVSGTPFGNYLPAMHMLTVSGWVNPALGRFTEFRCAAVISAGSDAITKLFATAWCRSTPNQAPSPTWSQIGGWNLTVRRGL